MVGSTSARLSATSTRSAAHPEVADPGEARAGTLYVVATPIGNLEDVTLRAVRVLGEVDLVAAEDTRRTRLLLDHLGLHKRLVSYYDAVESSRAPELVRRLLAGESIALVSDAGTPLVADPGFRLVRAASEAGVAVVSLPGASAPLALLACSGLPTVRFSFVGFLPPRSAARRREIAALAGRTDTLVFFESPRRLVAALRFDRVLACKSRNIDLSAPDRLLDLVGFEFHAHDAPAGSAILLFAHGGAIRLDVECLECELTDLGEDDLGTGEGADEG